MQLALYIGSIPVFKATEDVAMHLGNDFVLKKKSFLILTVFLYQLHEAELVFFFF